MPINSIRPQPQTLPITPLAPPSAPRAAQLSVEDVQELALKDPSGLTSLGFSKRISRWILNRVRFQLKARINEVSAERAAIQTELRNLEASGDADGARARALRAEDERLSKLTTLLSATLRQVARTAKSYRRQTGFKNTWRLKILPILGNVPGIGAVVTFIDAAARGEWVAAAAGLYGGHAAASAVEQGNIKGLISAIPVVGTIYSAVNAIKEGNVLQGVIGIVGAVASVVPVIGQAIGGAVYTVAQVAGGIATGALGAVQVGVGIAKKNIGAAISGLAAIAGAVSGVAKVVGGAEVANIAAQAAAGAPVAGSLLGAAQGGSPSLVIAQAADAVAAGAKIAGEGVRLVSGVQRRDFTSAADALASLVSTFDGPKGADGDGRLPSGIRTAATAAVGGLAIAGAVRSGDLIGVGALGASVGAELFDELTSGDEPPEPHQDAERAKNQR